MYYFPSYSVGYECIKNTIPENNYKCLDFYVNLNVIQKESPNSVKWG